MTAGAYRAPALLVCLVLGLELAGCGGEAGFVRERRVDYQQVRTLPVLEIPPDLSQVEQRAAVPEGSAATTFSSFTAGRGGDATDGFVLRRPDNIRVENDGASRWLVIEGTPSQVWPRVREFWLQQGFLIKREDPQLGILETDWAENRADIPLGFIRKLIGKVLDFAYSAPTRDKYRVRLEPLEDGRATALFLTHWGVQEVVTGGTGAQQSTDTVWGPRPSDPELEAEFLNRLIVHLGIGEEQAERMMAQGPREPRARITEGPEGAKILALEEGFARAWRLTGVALDHLGFVVEDSDRDQGTYVVRASEPLSDVAKKRGFFSKLAFWREDEQEILERERFVVTLSDKDEATQLRVAPQQSESPVTARAADQILALLEQRLR